MNCPYISTLFSLRKSTVLVSTLLFLAFLMSCVVAVADDAVNQFNAAKTAFDMKQYSQAQTGFETFLAKYRNHAQTTEATFYLAESLLYLERYPQAEIYYNQLVSLGLENPYARVALFRVGDIAYLQGKYDIAKPRLEQFVESLPHDINLQFVLYYLGDIAMRGNSVEEAEHYFRQSVTLYPNGPKFLESQIGLAWAKNQLGFASEANAIFNDLLRSNDPAILEPATYQWGVAQYERGDYQAAVTTLAGFQQRWPRSTYFADSQRVMARCKGGLNDFAGALQIVSQIAQPTIDDELLKVRCLYRQRQFQNAMDVLTQIERRAGPEYRDEITLLQSVFYFDQKNWAVTIAKLESILTPVYDDRSGRMTFNYLSRPALSSTANRLPDDTVLKACALLALTYAKNGQTNEADATIREMQSQATMLGGSELHAIVTETQKYLSNIYAENNSNGNRPGGNTGSGQGQWNAGNQGNNRPGSRPGGNTDSGQWNAGNQGGGQGGSRPGMNNGQGQWNAGQERPGNNNRPGGTINNGTDLEQFQNALQQFERSNWSAAAQQLDQLLATNYNRYSKQATIGYNPTGMEGAMNAVTAAKAGSMLVLSRAQLGDFDQANALLTALASKIQMSDRQQQSLYAEAQSGLFELARNGAGATDQPGRPGNTMQYTEAEQKALLRECTTLYKNRRFDLADTKLRELIAGNPVETIRAEALLLRSKTIKEMGREREAIQLLETICDEHAHSEPYADALWFLGTYYESGGDLDRAVEYFEPLAREFPNGKNVDGALYYLGVHDMEYDTGRKANSYFTKIYKNYQHGKFWSHAAWMLAYEAYRKRDYALAENYVQKVLQHPPDRVILDRVLYLKGELALRSEEYETAFVAFKEVGKLCPDSPLRYTADKNMQIAAEKTLTATR